MRRRVTAGLALVVLMGVGAPLAGQQIQGVVRDRDSGAAIPYAELTLRDTLEAVVATVSADADGRFVAEAPAGPYWLEVARIGYAAARYPRLLTLRADRAVVVAVLVTAEAVRLNEVVVETRSERRREAVRRGTVLRLLTRADIEELQRRTGPRNVGDLVRRFAPDLTVTSSVRGMLHDQDRSVCIEALQRMKRTTGCDMVLVLLDGITIEDPGIILEGMDPDQVESIEFLKPSEGGLRYGTRGGNGVLIINTMNGRRARRRAPPPRTS